ncbi:MAG: hypothetical protein WDA18_08275 [Candidatus Ratteibacteria bacterium]
MQREIEYSLINAFFAILFSPLVYSNFSPVTLIFLNSLLCRFSLSVQKNLFLFYIFTDTPLLKHGAVSEIPSSEDLAFSYMPYPAFLIAK